MAEPPDGQVNALTIDLEDWYHGLELPPSSWGGLQDRVVRSTRRLLELLRESGARATFFVLGPIAERHEELVDEIRAAGHEIGSHGCSHQFVYRLTPKSFREEMVRSIGLLQDHAGRAVVSYRAPYFSITRQSAWAFEILAALGIRNDSSVFPVHNYRYGNADSPRSPHPIQTPSGPLVEFPISVWRVFGQNLPVGGGAYFRILPYALTRTAIRALNRGGHPVVFYLHPWELDPDHPRLALPRRIAATHYFNLRSTEHRLRRLLRDFCFVPLAEVPSGC
ncbi:MAG TPA: XrtA system polysaccharide deacetylase [Candidatus Saccharimonadales bacterium]|nr:XrtA system polysaccharide deacetylase [Candidatus Saccharimonadales bacterium]